MIASGNWKCSECNGKIRAGEFFSIENGIFFCKECLEKYYDEKPKRINRTAGATCHQILEKGNTVKMLLAALLFFGFTAFSQESTVIVSVRRLAGDCLFCQDSVWLDTLPNRPLLAGGQYSSAHWTLPSNKYTVEVKKKP